MNVSFLVHGKPIPQPRHRAASIAGHARVYLPRWHPVNGWKTSVWLAWRDAGSVLFTGPVSVTANFILPASKSEAHKRREDLDNLAKALLDALTGHAFEDDRQVVHLDLRKIVTEPGGRPATRVVIADDSVRPGELQPTTLLEAS